MLCSRYLDVQEKHGRVYWALERVFQALERGYRRVLGWSLRQPRDRAAGRRWSRSSPPCRCSRPCRASWRRRPTKAASWSASARRSAPRSTTPRGKLREVEAIAKRYPEIVTEFGVIGLGSAQQVNQATLVVRMKPRGERERSQQRRHRRVPPRPRAGRRRARLPARLRPGAGPALRAAAVRGEGAEPAGDGSARHRAAAHAAGRPADRAHGHRPAARPAAAGPRARPRARRRVSTSPPATSRSR